MPPLSITRCPWPGIEDPLYARYHDTEWGVPLTDSQALFEKIVLEGFQAGLSWLTILRKRENFRRAFDRFDADMVAKYKAADVTRLMSDAGIIRHLAKIEATIDNAKAYITIEKKQSFASFIWNHIDGSPIQNTLTSSRDAPSQTELSKRLSRALKTEGFRFVGPTTIYAFMQSSGMTNDHLMTCPRHAACRKLQLTMKGPIG